MRIAGTSNPEAYDIDLIDPDEDLRAAMKRGELRFIGEALFDGKPTCELLLDLDHPCGVILPDARIFVERDSFRPVAVRLGAGLLRYLTIEEVPLEESRLRMGKHKGPVVKAEPPIDRSSACPRPRLQMELARAGVAGPRSPSGSIVVVVVVTVDPLPRDRQVLRLRVQVLELDLGAADLARPHSPDVEATPGVALVDETVVPVRRPVAPAEVHAATRARR
jgi:hypothetical protein